MASRSVEHALTIENITDDRNSDTEIHAIAITSLELSLCVERDDGIKNLLLQPDRMFTIGRGTEEIPPPEYVAISCGVMSRRHAELWLQNSKVFIRDLGSLNGTFVNGERLSPECCKSVPYEVKNHDRLEFGLTSIGAVAKLPGFSCEVVFSSAAHRTYTTNTNASASYVQDVLKDVKDWIADVNAGLKPCYWYTHPDESERFLFTSYVAQFCEEARISSPRLYLSRRLIDRVNIPRLLLSQLNHFIPKINQHSELENNSFNDGVDDEWLRSIFENAEKAPDIRPLLLFIIECASAPTTLLCFLRSLMAILREKLGFVIKVFFATHPDGRRQASIDDKLLETHTLNEIHVVDPLDDLPVPIANGIALRKNLVSFLEKLKHSRAPFYQVVHGPLRSRRPLRTSADGSPLKTVMDLRRLQLSFDSVVDELKPILERESYYSFQGAKNLDFLADQATFTSILRIIIQKYPLSPLELKGDEAQLFVDLAQTLSDTSVLSGYHGHDFDRKVRQLVSKVSAASDVLPRATFLLTGVELQNEEPFSGGGYADIFHAKYAGEEVALKRLRIFRVSSNRSRINRKFCREALTWRPLKHPHILRFLGVDNHTFPSYLCMVSPWMQNGTVMEYRERITKQRFEVERIVFETADGLEYLHFEEVVHGDLRGANILIDDTFHVRLADFGLTVHSDASAGTESQVAGNVRWMAPELLYPEGGEDVIPRKTQETDVYSFACVVLELYQGQHPFYDTPTDASVLLQVSSGARPNRPYNGDQSIEIPEHLWSGVVEECWHQDRYRRPSMEYVKAFLRPVNT